MNPWPFPPSFTTSSFQNIWNLAKKISKLGTKIQCLGIKMKRESAKFWPHFWVPMFKTLSQHHTTTCRISSYHCLSIQTSSSTLFPLPTSTSRAPLLCHDLHLYNHHFLPFPPPSSTFAKNPHEVGPYYKLLPVAHLLHLLPTPSTMVMSHGPAPPSWLSTCGLPLNPLFYIFPS